MDQSSRLTNLLHLAWPVIVAQLAVMLSGVIDTVMAGHLSALDLAAVGIGASIHATVFVTLMGVLLALTPVVAHHYGAERFAEIGADVRQCAWLALLLSVLGWLLLKHPDPFLALSRLTPDLEERVRNYLDGMAWAMPGIMFFRVFYGFTSGIGRPRPVMVFNLLGLALKAPLNVVFMYGLFGLPALGGAGCGWSSAVGMWVVALLTWTWCRRDEDYRAYRLFDRFEPPRWKAMRELLALGLPMGITFLVDVSAFTFMALFIARLGANWSAAHQIVANVVILVFMIPLSLGHATGVLVGQALGANEAHHARQTAWTGLRVALVCALVVAAIGALAAPWIAAAYTRDALVVAYATDLMRLAVLYHVADAVQTVMLQVLRGYKRATVPMAVCAVALWGVGLGGGYLLGLTDLFGPARGAAGFWAAAIVGYALAGLSVTGYFLYVSAPKQTLRNIE